MKKILLIMATLLLAPMAGAGQLSTYVLYLTPVFTNAATPIQTNLSTARGYIESITIDVIVAGTTGAVQVLASPQAWSTLGNVVLATNSALAADTLFRPRFRGTDVEGNAVSNVWARYELVGEDLIFKISEVSATNAAFRALIKIKKD